MLVVFDTISIRNAGAFVMLNWMSRHRVGSGRTISRYAGVSILLKFHVLFVFDTISIRNVTWVCCQHALQ